MTPDIETEHREENGEQVTTRTVVLTDAVGRETRYPYEFRDGEHVYVGEEREDAPAEPTDRAEQVITCFEDADALAEFEAAVAENGGEEA